MPNFNLKFRVNNEPMQRGFIFESPDKKFTERDCYIAFLQIRRWMIEHNRKTENIKKKPSNTCSEDQRENCEAWVCLGEQSEGCKCDE